MQNLIGDLPDDRSSEIVEIFAKGKNVRIERIVSFGQVSPGGVWYDQDQTEWVVVLKGEARLLIEGDESPIHMKPGDYVTIPAHSRHRVEWTMVNAPTIWLAVFFDEIVEAKLS